MKKIIVGLLVFTLAGCVTVKTPNYIQSINPYEKQFFAPQEEVFKATTQALDELGWEVSEITSPSIYEQRAQGDESSAKQVLIFTEVRQTPLFLSSKYMNINVFLRPTDEGTEVEIRYASVMPVFFKSIESYRNDPVVKKILDRIESIITQ